MTRQTIGQTARHTLSAIDEQRPQLKYYSLGFYGAWILLMMGGTGVAGVSFSPAAFDANVLLYLYSGVPLSLCSSPAVFCTGVSSPISCTARSCPS